MRTTITLDEDVAAKVQTLMRERGVTFKEAINQTLRSGLSQGAKPVPYKVPVRDMRLKAGVDLTKALDLASKIEDEANIRDMEERK